MNESFIKVGSKSRTSRLELAQLVSARPKLHCKPVEPVNRLFLKGRLSFGIQNNELPAIKTRAKKKLSTIVQLHVCGRYSGANEAIDTLDVLARGVFFCSKGKQTTVERCKC